MATDSNFLRETYDELKTLREALLVEGNQIYKQWSKHIQRDQYIDSAKNLAYYIALRRRNVYDLQMNLAHLGFTALDHLEADVLHKIDNVLTHMSLILAPNETEHFEYAGIINDGAKKLEANADLIFGQSTQNTTARIMVTMPPHATEDLDLITEMLEEGMTVARVNAAHESPAEWQEMLNVIKQAEQDTGQKCRIYFDIAGAKVRINSLYTTLQRPRVASGDKIFITAKDSLKTFYDMPLVLGCSAANMLEATDIDDRIILDDGKIIGQVVDKKPEGLIVEIKQTKRAKGENIRATKGINFPDSKLKLDVLTAKDKENLIFARDTADIIGFSYIQDVEDIDIIHQELVDLYGVERATNIPITLKIETVSAFLQLPEILASSAGKHPTAVMIARGDLAVEAGYYDLAEMQEAILSVCEAAHIPVIWATQVLESVAKTGIPTRSEITDVVTSARADVVMLNKGPYITEAIEMLNRLIDTRQTQYDKNTEILHKLTMATRISLDEDN